MKIKRYVMVGLVYLLALAVLPVSLSAQEDDREDMLLVIDNDRTTLRRVSLDGSFSQVLGRIYYPTGGAELSLVISPDEEWILYQDPTQRLHRMRVNGTDDQLLSEGPAGEPTWSPDGQWLIFRECDAVFDPDRQNDVACDLYAMDWLAEDITIRRLTDLAQEWIEIDQRLQAEPGIEFEEWSPDGQWLVFSAGAIKSTERDLYRLNINEPGLVQQITNLPDFERIIGWSRDNQWLCFTSESSYVKELYTIPMDDEPVDPAKAQRLMQESCDMRFLGWSQDQQWLFVTPHDCATDSPNALYGVYLASKPEMVLLTEGAYTIYNPDWIVENKEFGLQGWPTTPYLHVQLNSANPSASVATAINDVSYYNLYSPDKNWLYFTGYLVDSNHEKPMHLYRIHPDGTGAELVFETNDDNRVSILRFTPDEQWIMVYYRLIDELKDGKPVSIYLMRPDGSEVQSVVEWVASDLTTMIHTFISSDEQWLYFAEGGPYVDEPWYLMSIDTITSGNYQLQPMTLPNGFHYPQYYGYPLASPDGNWLYWAGEYISEYDSDSFMIFRSPVGSTELQFFHTGHIVGWIRARR